jgi:hypothetical protein
MVLGLWVRIQTTLSQTPPLPRETESLSQFTRFFGGKIMRRLATAGKHLAHDFIDAFFHLLFLLFLVFLLLLKKSIFMSDLLAAFT